MFIFVLPGLICLGLVNAGIIPPLPLDEYGVPRAGETYSHLIRNVLPIGAQGIVLAALLAALMSTVSGALNSIATLVSYDIYKRWSPDASDRKLVRRRTFRDIRRHGGGRRLVAGHRGIGQDDLPGDGRYVLRRRPADDRDLLLGRFLETGLRQGRADHADHRHDRRGCRLRASRCCV